MGLGVAQDLEGAGEGTYCCGIHLVWDWLCALLFLPQNSSALYRNRPAFIQNKDSYMPWTHQFTKAAQSRPRGIEIPGTKCFLSEGLEATVTLDRVIRKSLCCEVWREEWKPETDIEGKPRGQQAKHKGWDLRRAHLLLAELVTVSVQLAPVCHSQ